MKKDNIVRYTLEELIDLHDSGKGRSDWARVDALTDEEIEAAVASDPDAELLPDDWLDKAELVIPAHEKERITLSLDRGVIAYFKKQGADYQARINSILRAYMLHETKERQTQ